MVYCSGLENRRTERFRGFKSYSLRWFVFGEVVEWFIAPVSKIGGLKGSTGSNPVLSVSGQVAQWQSGWLLTNRFSRFKSGLVLYCRPSSTEER